MKPRRIQMTRKAPWRADIRWGSLNVNEIRRELAGRDLACWCPLDSPCHGDVLLAIAGGEAP